MTSATNDAISDDFGGVFQMIVETGGDWQQTSALVESLEALSDPRTVLSEVNFARWLGHPGTRPSEKELETLPKALFDQLRGTAGETRIYVSVPEPMRSDECLREFDAIYDAAFVAGAERRGNSLDDHRDRKLIGRCFHADRLTLYPIGNI